MSVSKVDVQDLLSDATAIGAGDQKEPYSPNRSFECYGSTSSGSGSAEIIIEVRNSESSAWKTMATVTLTLGTSVASDGFASSVPWRYIRARVSAISGTGATVSANVGTADL